MPRPRLEKDGIPFPKTAIVAAAPEHEYRLVPPFAARLEEALGVPRERWPFKEGLAPKSRRHVPTV